MMESVRLYPFREVTMSFRFLSAIAALVLISACDTTEVASREVGYRDFASTADTLIDRTKVACGFMPSVTAISALLSGGSTAPIGTIANAICAEVAKLPELEADEGPTDVTVTVNGVRVQGTLL